MGDSLVYHDTNPKTLLLNLATTYHHHTSK
jgi:hypothetical protein